MALKLALLRMHSMCSNRTAVLAHVHQSQRCYAQQHKQRLAAVAAQQQQQQQGSAADAEAGTAAIGSGLRLLGPKTRSHFADAAE